MPRGLGDDPLSRERKNGRRGHPGSDFQTSKPSVAADPDAPRSVQPPIQAEPIAEAASSSRLTLAYDDVFFRRRSEEGQGTSYVGMCAPKPSVTEPDSNPIESTRIRNPEVTVSPTALSDLPRQQSEGETATAGLSPVPNDVSQDSAGKAGTVRSETEGRGFFKRIFGKLRQR